SRSIAENSSLLADTSGRDWKIRYRTGRVNRRRTTRGSRLTPGTAGKLPSEENPPTGHVVRYHETCTAPFSSARCSPSSSPRERCLERERRVRRAHRVEQLEHPLRELCRRDLPLDGQGQNLHKGEGRPRV